MATLSSPAIILRIIEHGDNDKIVTAFTLDCGKSAFIAKGAKKSQKRFGGTLDIFSALQLVWATKPKRGLPLLQEASVIHPFDKIRSYYDRMVLASHWCELVYRWMDEGKKQEALYKLLTFALGQLNEESVPPKILHLIFQLHFLALNGFEPNLGQCTHCQTPLDHFEERLVFFAINQGGILCKKCRSSEKTGALLLKGTVKQLLWILNTPLAKVHRLQFSDKSMVESFTLLETFILHHLGKETKSMKLVREIIMPPSARQGHPQQRNAHR